MRAICCAILALVFWFRGYAAAKDRSGHHEFVSLFFDLLSYALAAASGVLCIAGL